MREKKVLIVDDSPTTLLMQQMILRPTAYRLLTAKDGADAVDVAIAERPDLVLMDIVMPRMTGLEACRRMRAEPELSAVPIILVSTRGSDVTVEEGYASGCTDYVMKPVDASELLAKIRNYLEVEP